MEAIKIIGNICMLFYLAGLIMTFLSLSKPRNFFMKHKTWRNIFCTMCAIGAIYFIEGLRLLSA